MVFDNKFNAISAGSKNQIFKVLVVNLLLINYLILALNVSVMVILHKLNRWANSHTNVWFDVLRIGFGVFLFIKGIQFSTHTEYLVDLVAPNMTTMGTMFIVHYVAMAHLCGGLFIVMGMLTRLTILIQIPILIGAVMINFIGVMDLENLLQSLAAILLASFFLIYGSGKHSVDYNLKLNM